VTAIGNQWIIDDGLKPGERVVAEGVQKSSAWKLIPSPTPRTAETARK